MEIRSSLNQLSPKQKWKHIKTSDFSMLNQYFRKNYIKAKKQADRFEELQQCKKIWKDNKRLFSNLKNCKGQLFKERR